MTENIDPTVGIPLAIILWAILFVITHRENKSKEK
jgi:hypothetical protein